MGKSGGSQEHTLSNYVACTKVTRNGSCKADAQEAVTEAPNAGRGIGATLFRREGGTQIFEMEVT